MRVASLVVALSLVVTVPARAFDITTCGQDVPPSETGVLQADLVGCDLFAVRIENRATLQMNGHAILGSGVIAVECRGKHCAILGPGEIANGGGGGGPGAIVQDYTGRGRPSMTLTDLNIHDNGEGFANVGGTVIAMNVVVNHNVTLNPNSSATPGQYIAAVAYRLFGTNLQVTDNIGFGIYAEKLQLTNSAATGNNGNGVGLDLFSDHRPVLISTICGKSLGPNGPWGVCTNDP